MQSKNPFHRLLAKPPVSIPSTEDVVAKVLEVKSITVSSTEFEDDIISDRANKSVTSKTNEGVFSNKENCSVLSPAVAKACKVRENRNHVENRLRLDLDMVMREKAATQKEVLALTTELEVQFNVCFAC